MKDVDFKKYVEKNRATLNEYLKICGFDGDRENVVTFVGVNFNGGMLERDELDPGVFDRIFTTKEFKGEKFTPIFITGDKTNLLPYFRPFTYRYANQISVYEVLYQCACVYTDFDEIENVCISIHKLKNNTISSHVTGFKKKKRPENVDQALDEILWGNDISNLFDDSVLSFSYKVKDNGILMVELEV
jgi:hypothetical protein